MKITKRIIIYGFSNEIDNYTDEFMDKVNCFVIDEITEKNQIYKGKPVKSYNWLLEQDDIFIIISNIYNKLKYMKKLDIAGFKKGKDYVWAPEWYGNESLPPCYPILSWKDNEKKYDFSQLEGPWDYRYKELLTLISEPFASVMDCGAGNMSLRRLLDKNVLYYPIDMDKKYPETIVCDFNNQDFPQINVDIIFLCGILEYIIHPEIFIKNVCEHAQIVLMTYSSLHTHPGISSRMLSGWKNHFMTGEIVKLFTANNFSLVDELYEEKSGIYLRFDKNRKENIL